LSCRVADGDQVPELIHAELSRNEPECRPELAEGQFAAAEDLEGC
jgi:hypothetical protein